MSLIWHTTARLVRDSLPCYHWGRTKHITALLICSSLRSALHPLLNCLAAGMKLCANSRFVSQPMVYPPAVWYQTFLFELDVKKCVNMYLSYTRKTASRKICAARKFGYYKFRLLEFLGDRYRSQSTNCRTVGLSSSKYMCYYRQRQPSKESRWT